MSRARGFRRYIHMGSLVFMPVVLGGCSEQRTLDDLDRYVTTLHRDTVPKVDPIPEQPPVTSVVYAVDESKDPFAPSNVFGTEEVATAVESEPDPLAPDVDRVKEALERFPMDALKLVGTMELENDLWALISAPDGQIHRVVIGSYLGQNIGRIVGIDKAAGRLDIEELVQGPSGRWETRLTELRAGG